MPSHIVAADIIKNQKKKEEKEEVGKSPDYGGGRGITEGCEAIF